LQLFFSAGIACASKYGLHDWRPWICTSLAFFATKFFYNLTFERRDSENELLKTIRNSNKTTLIGTPKEIAISPTTKGSLQGFFFLKDDEIIEALKKAKTTSNPYDHEE